MPAVGSKFCIRVFAPPVPILRDAGFIWLYLWLLFVLTPTHPDLWPKQLDTGYGNPTYRHHLRHHLPP